MKSIIAAFVMLSAIPAIAAESRIAPPPLTLNDLPQILSTIRQCREASGGMFSKPTQVCDLPSADVWASVHDGEGGITIYFARGSTKIYASGLTVDAAVRDLGAKLNAASADNKRTLDAIAPLLPTQ